MQLRLPFALLLMTQIWVTSIRAEQPFSYENTPCCLPADVRPTAYRVSIKPDLDRLSHVDNGESIEFSGEATIDVNVLKPTDSITLNAANLSFESKDVNLDDGEPAKEVLFHKDSETAEIRFSHKLPAGRHKFYIRYTGMIARQANGLYFVDYDTSSGKKRMLVTQFQATDARRVFPSWDEPSFKASIELTAELPESFRAISNMPILHSEQTGEGRQRVTFAPTPKMSSYLTALVAGEFESVSAKVGTDIRVYAPMGHENFGRYALGSAQKILPYYIDYFGVDYSLPKLDLIAIPNFAASAMENWGAITYIDSSLLFDPSDSTEKNKEEVFQVVAHEMAHQWSGNLVTMAWWDNLWLNEGFATWMQYKSTDFFNPGWKTWLSAHRQKEEAMQLDARSVSHAIQQPVASESKIDSAFDVINYEKGAAVIRMIENYLGEDRFREGMRLYMRTHAYSNATTADLWSALEEASHVPVASIARGFTEYPGIPLIHVETSCVHGETIAEVKQERFTVHAPYAEPRTWQVPVTISTINNPKPRKLLLGEVPEKIKFSGCGDPLKANLDDVGYYRVEYSPAAFKALARVFKRLSAADRVNFLSDAWAMVQAGRAEPQSYLDLMNQLTGETELAVWSRVIDTLVQIDDLARGSSGREAFRTYALGLLKPALGRLGWETGANEETEHPTTLQLRALLIKTLAQFGDSEVVSEARRRFALFLDNPQSLHKDLREAVAVAVGHAPDRTIFDQLRNLGRRAIGTEEKLRYYYALAGTHEPALIEEVVNIALTEEISSGRVDSFLIFAAKACDDPDRVWDLVLSRREPILRKLTREQRQGLLPMVAMASSNPTIAFDLRWKVAESRASEGASYEAGKAADEIEFKASFKERVLPAVEGWLKSPVLATLPVTAAF